MEDMTYSINGIKERQRLHSHVQKSGIGNYGNIVVGGNKAYHCNSHEENSYDFTDTMSKAKGGNKKRNYIVRDGSPKNNNKAGFFAIKKRGTAHYGHGN